MQFWDGAWHSWSGSRVGVVKRVRPHQNFGLSQAPMQSITLPAIKGTSQTLMGSETGWHKRPQGSVARKRMNPTIDSRNPKRSNANAVFRFRSKSMVRPALERPYSELLHGYLVPKRFLKRTGDHHGGTGKVYGDYMERPPEVNRMAWVSAYYWNRGLTGSAPYFIMYFFAANIRATITIDDAK